jgi:hypothetical protein
MTPTVRVLVPTGKNAKARLDLAARPESAGRLGFLHNGQPHFDQISRLLLDSVHTSEFEVTQIRKPSYGAPATDEMLDELAEHCGIAITGLAC